MRLEYIRRIRAKAKLAAAALWISLALSPAQAEESFIPNLFDPHQRIEAPDLAALKPIRFLTGDDYPPFEFIGADGALTGFNIDVARALCRELKLACTIQPRRWDNLLPALTAKDGDAIIASLKENAASRQVARFTAPYYLTPARFMALAGAAPLDTRPEALRETRLGVVAGSAHAAFLQRFFPRSTIRTFDDQPQLTAALRDGQIDLAFGDGVSLARWMNEPAAQNCCRFVGGPFLEPEFFGEGVGVALRPDDDKLRLALNWALKRLDEKGVMGELYLKYFPIGIY
jgi:polar amino acid transport system substrate-binding protein